MSLAGVVRCPNHANRSVRPAHAACSMSDECPCCSRACRACRRRQRVLEAEEKTCISEDVVIKLWEAWRVHANVWQMVTQSLPKPPLDIFRESVLDDDGNHPHGLTPKWMSPPVITLEQFNEAKRDVERMARDIKELEPNAYTYLLPWQMIP